MVLGKSPETVYKALSKAILLLISPQLHVVNCMRCSLPLPEFSHTLFPRYGISRTSQYLIITHLSFMSQFIQHFLRETLLTLRIS